MEHSVAQGFGLGAVQLGLGAQEHRLGEQVCGNQRELDPDVVDVVVAGGQVPDAGVLPGPDPVLDADVRPVPCLEERQLPASGVGGERLVALAVADVEGVQGLAGVREFAADDHAHPRAGLPTAAQVEQVRDLDDVRMLAKLTIAVVRGLPGPLRSEPDLVPDGLGDGVADRTPGPGHKERRSGYESKPCGDINQLRSLCCCAGRGETLGHRRTREAVHHRNPLCGMIASSRYP